MKIRTVCNKCKSPNYVDEFAVVELNENHIHKVTCANGHEFNMFLQNHHFELLLQFGGLSYIDGYLREAVVNISSAYERFLEFYIQVFLYKQSIDKKNIEKYFKLVNLSERELGSFLLAYLLENKSIPESINIENKKMGEYDKKTTKKFRNDVIHKGIFPNSLQVLEYGEIVFKFIRELLNGLLTDKDTLQQYISSLLLDRVAELKIVVTTQHIPTMISTINNIEDSPKSFHEGLQEIQKSNIKNRAFHN